MSEEQATHHTLVTSFWMLNFCSFSVLNTSGNVMYIRKKPTLLSFGREEHMRCMCVCICTSVHAQICIYIQSSNTDKLYVHKGPAQAHAMPSLTFSPAIKHSY